MVFKLEQLPGWVDPRDSNASIINFLQAAINFPDKFLSVDDYSLLRALLPLVLLMGPHRKQPPSSPCLPGKVDCGVLDLT